MSEKSAKKAKKEKKSKGEKRPREEPVDARPASSSKKKSSSNGGDNNGDDGELNPVCAIASPLADAKLTKKLLKVVKKGEKPLLCIDQGRL